MEIDIKTVLGAYAYENAVLRARLDAALAELKTLKEGKQ